MNDIYSLSYELKDILSQDERVILLNKLEEEMNTNEEVMKLAYQKDVAVSNYSDALNHFDENSKEAKDAHHEMFLAKEALDNHPVFPSDGFRNDIKKDLKNIHFAIVSRDTVSFKE